MACGSMSFANLFILLHILYLYCQTYSMHSRSYGPFLPALFRSFVQKRIIIVKITEISEYFFLALIPALTSCQNERTGLTAIRLDEIFIYPSNLNQSIFYLTIHLNLSYGNQVISQCSAKF